MLSAIIFALLIWTIWGNTALTVNNIKISSSRIPAVFSGFRIAQVSDLHNAEFGKGNKKLLELLSESKPDIIVITGDFVDAGHTDIDVAFDFAKVAVNIAPVYYVTGNHEASLSQYDELKTGLEAIGVIVLEDEAIQLKHEKETITLIGLSDPNFTLKGDMFGEAPAMVSTKLNSLVDDESSYTILLSHRPELFESYAHCNIDLVLSGHAHGGQFRLPFIGGLIAPDQGIFPKYDAGLFTNGSTKAIVENAIRKLEKIPEPECSQFVAATKARFLAERDNSIRQRLAAAKAQEPIMQGHDLLGIERFHPETRHMITLEVQKQCFVGFKGERFRFFLSDEGYRNAKRSEQEGEIKIKSHAAVVAGKLYPDKKPKQQER